MLMASAWGLWLVETALEGSLYVCNGKRICTGGSEGYKDMR